jgi:hypothetical protein
MEFLPARPNEVGLLQIIADQEGEHFHHVSAMDHTDRHSPKRIEIGTRMRPRPHIFTRRVRIGRVSRGAVTPTRPLPWPMGHTQATFDIELVFEVSRMFATD